MVVCWGETWELTPTMRATLDESTCVLTISTTQFAEPMPDYEPLLGFFPPYLRAGIFFHTVVIKNGVTRIGNSAFHFAYSLEHITIPNTVTSIGERAFASCSYLHSLDIPNSVIEIGEGAFESTYLLDSQLFSVRLPNSVTKIGSFRACVNLTYVNIPDQLTTISDCMFCGCSSISSLIIPNSVTVIESDAFAACRNLRAITIPSSVTTIGSGFVSGCSVLEKITVEWARPLFVSDDLFCGVNISVINLYVPSGSKSLYETAPGWKDFGKNIVEYDFVPVEERKTWELTPTMTATLDRNTGVLTISTTQSAEPMPDYDFSAPYLQYFYANFTSVVIEEGVTRIGDYAFCSNYQLESVTIPSTVTSIGKFAFAGSSLSTIDIPNSVTAIGEGAFEACSLFSINIPNSVTAIGAGAFRGCYNLLSFNFPNRLTTIENFVFWNCKSISSIIIPNSLSTIGKHVFFWLQ